MELISEICALRDLRKAEVFAVEAEADPENVASQKVLEKCGFQATGEIGEEGPRFIVYKKPGSINRS